MREAAAAVRRGCDSGSLCAGGEEVEISQARRETTFSHDRSGEVDGNLRQGLD